MSERTENREAIFHAASVLNTPEERERFLDRACLGDADLRGEVEELLAAAEIANDLFQSCERSSPGIHLESVIEHPGSVIGRYKLLEKIGEGGMGIVYMAEQDLPVRRKVALKIIKLGMDTRAVVARFEAERQALAMMDHPNIAQVYDAGATEAGRPYFVMELVQGVPITEFCVANQLSIKDRLHLFVSVCNAIQSAHQKGIIHRDIKPSNVLVTMHNSSPHPMIIDFGVAKAIDQKLTEKTLFTNFATMIGTPAYMSPEQAEMSRLDVDTRSDIYSLGILLYELLTGTTPFPEERLRSVAYAEMQRIISEEEPERPSTRLRKNALLKPSSKVLNRPSSLATDLDWIVMKCLEKDRNRRYETATGLTADIRALLNNEPIMARPPSTLYRLQKGFRKNKVAFAAALAVVLTLLSGIAATLWQLVRAQKAESVAKLEAAKAIAAEKKATEEAATARAVTDFLYSEMFSSHPYETPAGDHTSKRAFLTQVARSIEGKFADQPLVEEQLRTALAVGLVGFSDSSNVIRQIQRLVELKRKRLPPGHSEILEEIGFLALNYAERRRELDAEQLLAEVAQYIPANGEPPQGAAVLLAARATLARVKGRPADSLPDLARAIPVLVRAYGPTDHRIVILMFSEALFTQEAGRTEDAERLWMKGIHHFEELLSPDHPAVAQFLKGHAYTLLHAKRPERAIPLLERALSIYRTALPENHHSALDAEDVLAGAYVQTGDIESAARIYTRTYPHWVKRIPFVTAISHCRMIADFFERQGEGFANHARTIRHALEVYENGKSLAGDQQLSAQGEPGDDAPRSPQ